VTGYLDRLAARLVEPRSHIRPRPLSRFEVVDTPLAAVEAAHAAGEMNIPPVPSARMQPPHAADDRREMVRHFASDMPTHAEAIETPADPQPPPITTVARATPSTPSTLNASTAEARDVRAPSGLDDAGPMSEPVEAFRLNSPVARHAMPAAVRAPVHASPAVKGTLAPPAIEDRISPWRAPAERLAEPAIDTRKTAQGPPTATMPQQRDKPVAAVDDGPAVVQVTIGRLEVRAPDTPRQPTAKSRRPAPRMSLQDYLQRRAEGRAR